VLFQFGPMLGLDQLDALAAKFHRLFAGLMNTPVILEAPGNHGLVDPSLADSPFFARFRSAHISGDGKLSRATGQSAANDACGCPLEEGTA